MPKPFALAAAALVAAAAPCAVRAQPEAPAPKAERPAGEMAREAIEQLMRALSLAIQNLPQYALPELNERGDIVIRRLNPRAEEPRPAPRPDDPDEART